MSMLAIAEILSAVAFFTALGALSYVSAHGKKEEHQVTLHNPAYIIYER